MTDNTKTQQQNIERLEAQVSELETKVAFQDHTIDQLNDEINQHQVAIAKLQNQLMLLGDRFKQIKDDMQTQSQSQQIEHELPPHY